MRSYKLIITVCLVLFLLSESPCPLQATSLPGPDTYAASARKVLSEGQSGTPSIAGHSLHAAQIAFRMMELSNFQPLWQAAATDQLKTAISELLLDGLQPTDYWFSTVDSLLSRQQQAGLSPPEQVKLDFLLTETFARAVYNLKFGKVDPVSLDKNINFSEQIITKDIAPVLLKYIVTGTIANGLQIARPQQEQYQLIRHTLARYRDYQEAGGWQPIQNGPPLKGGDQSLRVAQMRSRLTLTGEYKGPAPDADIFDQDLLLAVQRFQEQHGLEADGIAGPQTLKELNIPVEQRINTLRVGLERLRWYLHEAKGEFVVADIAGFQLYWVQNNTILWQDRIQVGANYTRTPIFKDIIRYMVINPSWTIPPGILKRTVLPHLKNDPEYLDKKGYILLSKEGQRLDAKTINWQSLHSIPYTVQQPPGPNNALGQIKFMFPNPHYVYLHDTNHRELFAPTRRTFSSGCIRVQHPFDFAEKLLAKQKEWSKKRLEQVVASGQTSSIRLQHPIRVIIAYNTTVVRKGMVFFREDIYQRDQAVLKALDGVFQLRTQDRPLVSKVN